MEDDYTGTNMAVRITALNLLAECNSNTPPKDIVKYGKEIYDWLLESNETGEGTVELHRVN